MLHIPIELNNMNMNLFPPLTNTKTWRQSFRKIYIKRKKGTGAHIRILSEMAKITGLLKVKYRTELVSPPQTVYSFTVTNLRFMYFVVEWMNY